MTNLTSKLAAMVCTLLLSSALIGAAVGPAEAGSPNAVVSATRLA